MNKNIPKSELSEKVVKERLKEFSLIYKAGMRIKNANIEFKGKIKNQ